MPKFEKSTGYKMKGSGFYGHGNSSPAKVSDDAVVAAQKNLDKVQLSWRTPGWAKAAKKVLTPFGRSKGKTTEAKEGGGGAPSDSGGGGGKGAAGSVQLKVNKNLLDESPKLKTDAGSGTWGTGGGLGTS